MATPISRTSRNVSVVFVFSDHPRPGRPPVAMTTPSFLDRPVVDVVVVVYRSRSFVRVRSGGDGDLGEVVPAAPLEGLEPHDEDLQGIERTSSRAGSVQEPLD